MQPIIHFLLSIVVGIGVGLHLDSKIKKYSLILLLAFAATCIDLDHLLPIYQETGIKIFHNVFVFVFFPVALLLIFCVYERGNGSTIKQRSCLLLCVMFVGHMFLDAISESGLPIFYPFRSDRFTVCNLGITIHPSIFTLTSEQVILLIWGAIICFANLYETITYNNVERRKPIRLELGRHRPYIKRRKSWLPAIIHGTSLRRTQISHSPETCASVIHEEEAQYDEVTDYIINFVKNLPN